MNENVEYEFEMGERQPCKYCGALIRMCWAGRDRTPWVVNATPDKSVRLYSHCCPARGYVPEKVAKFAANLIVGKPDECRYCGAPIRTTYLINQNRFWLVNEPTDPAAERLYSHHCDEYLRVQAARGDK